MPDFHYRSVPLLQDGIYRVQTTTGAQRNPGIDLLRGLSIILVVIHHLALRIPLMQTGLSAVFPARLLKALTWDGPTGVKIFFVISGFLITDHTLRRWGSPGGINVFAFSARRACRILPCLLVLLGVLAVLNLAGVPDFLFHHDNQTLPGALFAALFMHLNLYEARTNYLPANWDVLWSLSVEELFYVAFPILCFLSGRIPKVIGSRLLALVFALLALSIPFAEWQIRNASEIWQDEAYGPGMSAIAMGVCAALLAHRLTPALYARLTPWLGWVGAFGVGFSLIDTPVLWATLGYGAFLFLTASCAALLLAFYNGWGKATASRFLAWPRHWGRLSYEIYLSHMFVVMPMVHLFRATGENWTLGWVWFIPTLGLSFCLGVLVDRFLSRPADRWLLEKSGLRRPQRSGETSGRIAEI